MHSMQQQEDEDCVLPFVSICQDARRKYVDFEEVIYNERNQSLVAANVFVLTPFFALAPVIAIGITARAHLASTETVSRLRQSWNGKPTISTWYWNTTGL